MLGALSVALGAMLLGILVYDAFATVFVPRALRRVRAGVPAVRRRVRGPGRPWPAPVRDGPVRQRVLGDHPRRDGVDVLTDAVRHDATDELVTWLGSTASQVLEATQAEAQYPLTAYFHVPDDDRALPQSLATLLELLTVARSVLDPQRYPELTRGRTVSFALRAASSHVSERALGLSATAPEPEDAERLERHDRARARLEQAGVTVRPLEHSRRDYVELRKTWDVDQRTLRSHFAYPPRS